ncbi:MAG: transketolase [Phycisphaeraceae bacterium]|nr:transketolase [Phycisphaeraceae bacterium]
MQIETLKEKANWVRAETLKLHQRAPGTRIASSLSSVELLVVLYYSGLLHIDPTNPKSLVRDRVIASKGHGLISLYPILADQGFFPVEALEKIGQKDSLLTIIPEPSIPGIETINGSLGHGLGVACGMALALKRQGGSQRVYAICGDGELNEGAVWEAVMFASHHELNNLTLIVDDNKISMLGYQNDIINIQPLEAKFSAFGWTSCSVDGHHLGDIYSALKEMTCASTSAPSALIAGTQKGRGVPLLECDSMSHVKTLSFSDVDAVLGAMNASR